MAEESEGPLRTFVVEFNRPKRARIRARSQQDAADRAAERYDFNGGCLVFEDEQ